MRKVVATELVSLDGVMESPEKWSFQFHNDEMAEANEAGMAAADAMVLGRVTYQQFASYWPYQNSASPTETLLEFMESAYQAGAKSAGWDREALRTHPPAREAAKLRRGD